MAEFRMPSLGADMQAGTLVEWLKRPGDAVKRGDIIAVVETQKGAIEIEVFETGTFDRVLVEPGTEVPVGTPIAIIRQAGELPSVAPPVAVPVRPMVARLVPAPAPAAVRVAVPTAATGEPAAASPAARKLAAERGVDLARLRGTGPGGAIVIADVEWAAQLQPQPPVPRVPGLDLASMRKAIAAAMARSKREIPHYYLNHAVEMTTAQRWLEQTNAARPPAERLLSTVLLLKAVAVALKSYPEFNGVYESDAFRPSSDIHIGTAIAIRGGGLAAPAIHDVDRKSLAELMAALRDLVARARAGRLRSSELFGPTITVTSLGERGVDTVFGVIYPPQVAIVGFGRIALRAWPVADRIEARPAVTATLAADHRVSDGHRGALFLSEIAHLLQEPGKL